MYNNPVKVVETNNWLDECKKYQNDLGTKNPIVITSRGNLKRQKLYLIFKPGSIISDIEPNPTLESCQAVINFSFSRDFDGVIALGGGSVMDTAKTVVAALGTGVDSLKELIEGKQPFIRKVNSIFIPTTHGTGSEVTMWGTIWDLHEKKKYSISRTALYPDVAILDGTLTLSLPLNISLITVLDALSHCFEAIWNKNANSRSTDYAIQAICLILDNVFKLKDNLNNLRVRQMLIKAACVAGLAFSKTKTAAAHSISYPLTTHFGIPHGIACSISIVPLLDINFNKIKNPLNTVINRMGGKQLEDLQKLINKIPEPVLKYSLREWNVKEDDLKWLVEEAFTKERMENNIVKLSKDEVQWVLEKVY